MVTIKIDKSKLNNYEEKSAFVSFKYDIDLVELMRSLPIRFYHKDTKEWEVPIDKIEYIKSQIPHKTVKIIGNLNENNNDSNYIPKGFSFKTEPFSHQIDGFKYGLCNNKWLLGDEQGLGKTKQVIDIAVAKKLQHNYKHCLIICCVNSLKWNWFNEVNTHSNESPYILGMRCKKGKWSVKGNKEKLEDLKLLHLNRSYFIITNVESLRVPEISNEINKLCKENQINMIAVDEIHKCNNHTSQQSKGLLNINADINIAMTGTPLMNKPTDLYLPLKWLGYENHSYYAFEKHYCIKGGFGGYEVIGYKNLDELQEKLNKIMLRRLKSDVLDLPDKVFIDEYVEMSNKQQKIYNEVFDDIKSNIDMIKIAANPLAQLIRLRQATGYTGILSSTIQESAKLDRLEQLVEDSVNNNQKVVVFSNWTQMTDIIYKRLKNYNPAIITGDTNVNDRQLMVDKFQNNNKCKVIIGTIGAMGTGLTLTAGTVVIFVDEPWTKASFNQAVDRCHRIGTTSKITVYVLLAKNTIDERIHEIVEKKGAMSDAIVDGKIVGNREDILNYLLS